MKIAYEPHPVTPERKAELRAQGFKIIDARFAPADKPAAEEKPKRRRKKAASTSAED
tara:strand:- start:9 stop:179 length:171 start_codon:yes stop_codon:yes gene_type:complete